MGILNFTPDSFNAASRVGNEEIKDRIAKMLADGADIVDIGGVSTRPGSTPVSEAEEWERLRPALETIAKHFPNAVFSVDTFRSEIARRAVVDYGVSIVNDITAGMGDSKMYETVARCKVPYIIM
ncbi:MAG: dihydropteroate synthase, partial [Bacteroidales bacterium]|nr:dihydropteroate synthase [Bacteroidales bacterium]